MYLTISLVMLAICVLLIVYSSLAVASNADAQSEVLNKKLKKRYSRKI